MRYTDLNALEREMCSGCENENNKYSNCEGCPIAHAPIVEIKNGNWNRRLLKFVDGSYGNVYTCSECGTQYIDVPIANYNFCPSCGARMEK